MTTMNVDSYVRLRAGVTATHDSQTAYGSTRGIGIVKESSYTQVFVAWRAGLLCGGDECWHRVVDLVELTPEEKVAHDAWIRA